MMDKHLFIAYASDDQFSEMLGVSLTSLYENNIGMEQVTVYVLEDGISKENQKKIESISETYGRESVRWINVRELYSKFQSKVSIDRGSLSQYARLFIGSCLPADLDRVLYLDCDTIINQSLNELWCLDMHHKTVAALMDAFSKWYRKNINLKSDDIMFNSGVMLIDLKRWRERKIEKKLVNFIRSKNGNVQQGDQGVLNAVLSKDTFCFEPKYNSLTIFYDFSYREMMEYRKPSVYYTEEEVKEAINHPVIIHYTTSFLSLRPWIQGCRHKYVDEWLKYKDKSPWKNENLWLADHSRNLENIYTDIAKVLPRKLAVEISGVLQAYGRPFYNYILMKMNRK